MGMRKEWVPWGMAAGRAMLGPVVAVGARSGWSGLGLATLIVTALLSDIFDGVLARRWRCDTAGVRLFDTLADTVFSFCVALAIWMGRPEAWAGFRGPLLALGAFEAARFAMDLRKFGKPASYHSYLAKTWGLVLACATVAIFASSHGETLFAISIALGFACNVEGLAMSLMLPGWRKDVKTLAAAWRLRRELHRRSATDPVANRSFKAAH